MPGPGEYRPDPTASISRIEDLPKPKIRCQQARVLWTDCTAGRSPELAASCPTDR